MHWYVPTFYGDFRLTPQKNNEHRRTVLRVNRATKGEEKLLTHFQSRAVTNQWVEAKTDILARKTVIDAPIHLVAAELSSILKPDRKLISAIKVAGGKIEEVTRVDLGGAELPAAVATAKAATTVAKPVRGCPATDFDQAELRARDVLRAFLSAEQLEDFEQHQKFVAVGADTGHRYMITSRHARDELACYQRSFYDLDERRPLCAHDWAVPAAEEMLALLVCVTTSGNETMLRQLVH